MRPVRRKGVSEASRVAYYDIDTRTWLQRQLNALRSYETASIALIFCLTIMLVGIVTPFLVVLASPPIYWLARRYFFPQLNLYNAPYRVPKALKLPDGSKRGVVAKKFTLQNIKHYYGEGTVLFGRTMQAPRLEVWASVSDLSTHMTILGTTGSGKTEAIYMLLVNQLMQDSGFILVDAKGDVSLLPRVFELTRRVDKAEEVRVLSFSGQVDFSKPRRTRGTNTFNMMASSSASMLIEVLSGMVTNSEGGGDVWEGRCLTYVAASTRPLVFLRDKEMIDLSPNSYSEFMDLASLERFVFHNEYPEEVQQGLEKTMGALKNFLVTLPGYKSGLEPGQQEQKTVEQFGYITMQLTRVFNDLGYNYGHIFDAKVGEVDISDVVLNRRCLVALLPAMERSAPTLIMLAKLIVGAIKQMMAASLGSDIEGSVRLIVDSRPTTARNVFRVVLDEVGYIMIPGLAVIAAQARSLNIAMTYAAQSYSDMQRGSEQEADAIWLNTTIKMIGKYAGGDDTLSTTWTRVKGLAGEVDEAVVSGYDRKENFFGGIGYRASDHVNVVRKSNIDLEFLQGLETGEFVIFAPKKYDSGMQGQGMAMVPTYVLYAQSEHRPAELRINDLIPISRAGVYQNNSEAQEDFDKWLRDGQLHTAFYKASFGEEQGVSIPQPTQPTQPTQTGQSPSLQSGFVHAFAGMGRDTSVARLAKFFDDCHEKIMADDQHSLVEIVFGQLATDLFGTVSDHRPDLIKQSWEATQDTQEGDGQTKESFALAVPNKMHKPKSNDQQESQNQHAQAAATAAVVSGFNPMEDDASRALIERGQYRSTASQAPQVQESLAAAKRAHLASGKDEAFADSEEAKRIVEYAKSVDTPQFERVAINRAVATPSFADFASGQVGEHGFDDVGIGIGVTTPIEPADGDGSKSGSEGGVGDNQDGGFGGAGVGNKGKTAVTPDINRFFETTQKRSEMSRSMF